jgi:tetratricopeptide (TPR) repeat protein
MKMKLKNLLFGTLIFGSLFSFAQDDENRECDRMRFLGSKAVEAKNWNEAATYYLKGEDICGNYDKKQYSILIGSLIRTVNSKTDKTEKTAYIDTLLAVYDRADKVDAYEEKDDLIRAAYIMTSSSPDNKKADTFFVRGIKAQGTNTREAYITYYYLNLYTMYYKSKDAEEKKELKKRLISEYFAMSKIISEANMSAKTQESLVKYFDAVVKSCDDILPDLEGFMSELSQDPEVKKLTVNNFLAILEKKECTESDEYFMLIDTLIAIDPSSLDAQLMKAKALMAQRKYGDAISTLRTAKDLSTDDDQKNQITYDIARAQFASGSYKAAYNTGMSVGGDLKGEGLIIAGQSVGQLANSCGNSTFERKSNNIYAVQLLQQGGASASIIAKYKANYPTQQECFDNGNPPSVTLTCWGVTVSPCN